jgi:hypothetical protein
MPGDQLETLAKFIHSRKQDTPYVVLLGSGLSMTSDLLKELGYADWNAFHAYVQLRSPNEWYSLLKEPLNALPLQEGYRCLVQLLQVGYFNVILTTNFDSLLDQALNEAKRSSPEEIDILVNGEQTTEYIIRALKNPQPRMKICLLRGRLHSKSVPDITGMLQRIASREILPAGKILALFSSTHGYICHKVSARFILLLVFLSSLFLLHPRVRSLMKEAEGCSSQ